MSTPNPMAETYPTPPKAVSQETHCIAGILTIVYGLAELNKDIKDVACLWLLHPRLQTQTCMAPIAASTIAAWNERQRKPKTKRTNLIAISFDQRNHGSREVDNMANEAWKSGNERHAQDMFASYHGTAMDTSQLLTYIPSYIFPMSTHTITHNMILGISLGAHAAWQCLFHDARITSAIIIIGCPDYVRLMSDRARLSKLDTWTHSSPKGSTFLGSKDFPNGLIEAVEKYDPAGLLIGGGTSRDETIHSRDPTAMEKRSLIPIMKSTLQNKRILNMSGSADKLVPYKCAEPFLRWLKNATSPTGWFKEGNVILEDIVFEGVKHEMSPGMVKEVHRFVCDTLDQQATTETGRRLSKI